MADGGKHEGDEASSAKRASRTLDGIFSNLGGYSIVRMENVVDTRLRPVYHSAAKASYDAAMAENTVRKSKKEIDRARKLHAEGKIEEEGAEEIIEMYENEIDHAYETMADAGKIHRKLDVVLNVLSMKYHALLSKSMEKLARLAIAIALAALVVALVALLAALLL
ncbi:MAG: hypothetical protein KGY55_02185 [Candidatus Thermoplasmatota archaeon]|nr:hypothetical protein [Candidatus Thermoplasmatota archaeon]